MFPFPHDNFLGTSDQEDHFIFVSIESDHRFSFPFPLSLPPALLTDDTHRNTAENNSSEGCGCSYKVLLRSLEKDTRFTLLCDNPKDRIKNLKQHPLLHGFRLQLIKEASFQQQLLEFEQSQLETKQYKFGILYRKSNQNSDDEIFSNKDGSPDFNHFLSVIGQFITLKGWDKFRGGLDCTFDTTGTHSVYTTFQHDFEILFHVSTLLPFDPDNPQQLHRKRHIGNDIVVVIFQDYGADPFSPVNWASHFNHIFIVVQPLAPLSSDGSSVPQYR